MLANDISLYGRSDQLYERRHVRIMDDGRAGRKQGVISDIHKKGEMIEQYLSTAEESLKKHTNTWNKNKTRYQTYVTIASNIILHGDYPSYSRLGSDRMS